MNENRAYVEAIRKELEAIYNGETTNEDGEQATFWDYFSDPLDFEYTVNSDRTYKSVKIWVALGGPNICIDTGNQEIKLFWGGERESIWLPSEICEEIDQVFDEYYQF